MMGRFRLSVYRLSSILPRLVQDGVIELFRFQYCRWVVESPLRWQIRHR